jgi:enediyne biosynthesis protein E4
MKRCQFPSWIALVLLPFGLIAACRKTEPPLDDRAPQIDTAPADASAGPPIFTDVTANSGIAFTYRNGEEADQLTILESLGGGVALIDYDQDGLLDIFVTAGGCFAGADGREIRGHPNRLYKNLGGWKFKDVTAEVGLPTEGTFYSHGVAVGDYDNDGWPDLLVTGYGRLALYRNDHGRFTDMTESVGLRDQRPLHWSTSAAWADLDGDGRADLFICHYVDWSFANHPPCPGGIGPRHVDVCSPTRFRPLAQQLFLSKANGTFQDATAAAGIKPGKGLGVVIIDVDHDGRPDIYVANDAYDNHLYLNRDGGRFEEVGLSRGVALSEQGVSAGSMGVDAADYDGSGHFSLFVTNFQQEPHDLYQNDGRGQFRHASRRAGITALGLNFVGFGTGFIDYDRDGAEDLFISNGHAYRYPSPPATLAQRAVLLHNPARQPGGLAEVRFQKVSEQAGEYFRSVHRGRGVAFGDLDNDGRVDIVVSHCNEPVAILRNTDPTPNHWLGVRLVGNPYRDAVGAELSLEVGGRKLTRAIKGGGGYLSANDSRVVFGLGSTPRADRLTVRWPSGRVQTWDGSALGADRYVRLREGEPGVD